MSFFFGKKKGPGGREGAGPPGAPPPAAAAGDRERVRATGPPSGIPMPTAPGHNSGSMNNSINSIGAAPGSDTTTLVSRARSEADSQFTRVGPPPANGSNISNLYPWSQRSLQFSNAGLQAKPFPRYGAAVNNVASKDGDIYIMGGLINASTVKGDLWMVDAVGLTCEPVKTEAEGPGPRVGHASLLVGNAFIVFGGDTKQEETDPLDDTLYLLNTSTKQWSRALPPGPRPAGRYGHTLNILGSKLYVFGGQVADHFFNDLVAFDLNQLTQASNRWEILITDSVESEKPPGTIPPGRTNHTIVTYNDKLYLFGGTDGMQWFNDVWCYEPRTNSWTMQDCIGYIPQPREGHSAALVNDVMYIFGGRTIEGTDLGDLAAFRISSRRWYTFQNMGPSPSPRSGHSMTAFDSRIVILAGEPSSPERDPTELSLVYILDTSKIRYPNDQQVSQTPQGERVAPNNRRPSAEEKQAGSGGGQVGQGREGPPNSVMSPPSQLPRSGGASPAPRQPPPQRTNNGSMIPQPGPPGSRSRTPTASEGGPRDILPRDVAQRETGPRDVGQGYPNLVGPRNTSMDRPNPQREMSPAARAASGSPAGEQRNTPKQTGPRFPPAEKNINGYGISPQRQPKPITEEPRDPAPASSRFVEPPKQVQKEPDVESRTKIEAMQKELEEMKARSAWYASELVLARKAGYDSNTAKRMSLDGVTKSLSDDDRPLLEALITMRSELAEVQNSVTSRVDEAAKKVADLEQQRDAAIREAAYAKAKLAAHGGSQSGTPQPDDLSRDNDSDRVNDHVRKLGVALATQSELQAKLDGLNSQLQTEKRAREVAEDNADAAHKRYVELDQGRNPGEVDSLRADLHEAQRQIREATAQRSEAQNKVRILEVDNDELKERLEESTNTSSDHGSLLTSLREAVSSSHEKSTMLEKKLQQEREQRENLQQKLTTLRTEHEERTSELESTTRKLRDAEDLAEKHAGEAERHRQVLISGLDKLNSKGNSGAGDRAVIEKRVVVLQQQVEEANSLVSKSQKEAETASEKLRRAEERIAGLEAYQQQASREGLGIRKQLQEALRTAQNFQTQHSDVKQQLESHQRDANALAIQHGALKDLLEERSTSSAARNLDSPSGRVGSPDIARLREVQVLLDESRRAHMETKTAFESSQQESERAFQERIEQLQSDYQSAVSYVKGAEKMLKRMKDELTKSKAQTARLQAEVDRTERTADAARSGDSESADWESERQALRKEIEEMQDTMKGSVYQLEQQIDEMRNELEDAQDDRDRLDQMARQAQVDLDKLRGDNKVLETRATDAETKVALLLDQVESSVDNYRRESRNIGVAQHARNMSSSSGPLGHSHNNSLGGDSNFSSQGTERNSLALDNLASELETLRTQWEGTRRSYRLSTTYDSSHAGQSAAFSPDGGLSSHLADWRRRLDQQEKSKEAAARAGPSGS